jgi:pilus assembly protein CpaD
MLRIKTRKPLAGAMTLALSLALGACGGMPSNRSIESIHQPVVERTNYALDLNAGSGGLSLPEQRRLVGWFDAMGLRYGDRIYVDDPLSGAATRGAVEAIAGRYGILVGTDAPVTPGDIPAGTVRVIVARSSASVPGCPDWSADSETNFNNGTSSNYGCAVNSNFAAMIADPEHLIHGASGDSRTTAMSSTKAIDSYREAPPTGQGGLKQQSSQSGK